MAFLMGPREPIRTTSRYLKRALPRGRSLPTAVWERRHRVLLALLWAHVVGISLFALLRGYPAAHSVQESVPVAVASVIASIGRGRILRSSAATVGVMTSSAVLVHLSGGVIEVHFHFFVMLSIIALYNDWIPFLLAVGYVVVHHGTVGVLFPEDVYNHPAAIANPWKWAAIHGIFVLMASAAGLGAWRLGEEARARAELILKSAGDGLFGLDRTGRVAFVNPAATTMLDWRASDLLGASIHEIIHHSRPDGSPYPVEECPITATLKDGTSRSVPDEVFWRKDRSSFPVEYTTTPITEGGDVSGAVVTFRDVSHQREIERLKDEFTSMVSHELRTPLTSISAALGFLAKGDLGPAEPKAQKVLDIAVTNTDRLVRLINDVLDIERLQSGRMAMHREVCHADELVRNAVDEMMAMADGSGVTLSVVPHPVRLFADADRIMQTLTNLLSNAIKFSPKGSTVTVTVRDVNGDALFSVADEGRGIPSEKLGEIFDRFRQVDASDSRVEGGTGLGLAICRMLVEQHGGDIWAESTWRKGSTFYFTIPSVRKRWAWGSGPGPQVLLCDDEPSVLEVMGILMHERGYRVIGVASGEEAVKRAATEHPDVIVLDLIMPGMSGWEVAAELRNQPATLDIPIIILSVLSREQASPVQGEVTAWVGKPMVEGSLFAALERALRDDENKLLVVEDDDELLKELVPDRPGA
jgi:PAS domain S-box-containing protein